MSPRFNNFVKSFGFDQKCKIKTSQLPRLLKRVSFFRIRCLALFEKFVDGISSKKKDLRKCSMFLF